MIGSNVINRKNKMKLKQSFILLMIFLVTFSGMMPSTTPVLANDLEQSILTEPEVSKDVDGEISKELVTGEDFNYHVNVIIPEDVSGYEVMSISDDLDHYLAIQHTSVLINGEIDDTFKVVVEDQKVSLTLAKEQIEQLVGKELQIQITTQIKDDVVFGEEIENVAEIVINSNPVLETNLAVVTPVELEGETNTDELDIETGNSDDTKELKEQSKEDEIKSTGKNAEKNPAVSLNANEVQEGISINDIDSYSIGNNGHIIQYDGNNLSAGFKGMVQLDNPAINNGLALGKNEDVFYGIGGSDLYKIYLDGTTEYVTDLESGSSAAAGAISPDGIKFYYLVFRSGQMYIANIDLNTLEKSSVLIEDKSGFASMSGGDFAFDGDGNLWFSRWSDDPINAVLAKVDLENGVLESIIPIVSDTGRSFSRAGGLSFLPNGKFMLRGNHTPGGGAANLFELDPATGIATTQWNPSYGETDYASRVYPIINPDLMVEKTNEPSDVVYPGDVITYTLKISNNGNLASTLTTVQDDLPEGTSYVQETTTLNGEAVVDVEETSPIFTGMSVHSPGESLEGVLYTGEENAAVVTFQVKVDEQLPSGTTIVNTGSISADGVESINSNEVENTLAFREPQLESSKSSTLENKADGNTDAANPEVGDTIRYTITTQNTIGDSLVENLVIADTIPDGLTYVTGSLEVDGEPVSDASDDDAGHVVDGQVTGNFGDITDTKEHTVTFLVTVNEGQAGENIENVAEVKGDNTDTDKPKEEVKIYPREPLLESKKSVDNLEKDKEAFEVGDTVVYTIMTRNTVPDSLVKDLEIMDVLPIGLEFVEDSLEVSHDGTGDFTNGIITASFGDVENTEWHIVTFEAIIKSGQSGKDIENIATVGGSNTGDPDRPEEEFKVDPKDPELASNKSSILETKADGNTDAANPEVGDTIRYTITTQNTIEDSLVENLVITDTVPDGLTYVTGSLEVDGEPVSDASDDDAGHVVDRQVTGNFDDITDTKEHTVTFLVTVNEGQAGENIENVAEVKGDNTDTDKPKEEVKIYPREPILESEKIAVNLEFGKEAFEVGDTVVYTIMTRNTVSDSLVKDLEIMDELPAGLEFVKDSLEVSHDGAGEFTNGIITASFGDIENTEWRIVTFEAIIKSGQSGKDIENIATVGGSNTGDPDRPEEEFKVDPKDPELASNKTYTLETKADGNTDAANPEVGDTIRYTIQTKNTIKDSLIENLVITDKVPEGLTYVSDSLEVDGESVTDATDGDAGHFADGQVTGSFGDIKDTQDHIVTFLVTVDKGQAGQDIKNIAVVGGDNTGDPDKPEEKVKVYPRGPKLESEKTAVNLDKDKGKYEVGDTVVYTIKARNTVSDSIANNLTITDKLPVGLEYVEDSLEVSHEGTGEFKDGTITTNFGDVNDTEWRTITFEVKILSSQYGKTIKNVATVSVDNDTASNHPEEKIVVEQKDVPSPEKTISPVDGEKDGVKNPSKNDKDEGKLLPKTATNIFSYILLGMIALLIGLTTLKRRKFSKIK